MSEHNQFYYENNGKNSGPVSQDEIIELAKNGDIHRDTLIWRQGYEDWKKLSESEIDISFLPPPVKQAVSNTPPPLQTLPTQSGSAGSIKSDNPFMYFINAYKNYAGFSGRARRKEYWFFTLFYVLITILLSIIESATGAVYIMWVDYRTAIPIGILSNLFALVSLIPGLAIITRRLHDTNRSGWWQLLHLIPLIGSIILLVFLCFDSQFGENKYGKNPKGLN